MEPVIESQNRKIDSKLAMTLSIDNAQPILELKSPARMEYIQFLTLLQSLCSNTKKLFILIPESCVFFSLNANLNTD